MKKNVHLTSKVIDKRILGVPSDACLKNMIPSFELMTGVIVPTTLFTRHRNISEANRCRVRNKQKTIDVLPTLHINRGFTHQSS